MYIYLESCWCYNRKLDKSIMRKYILTILVMFSFNLLFAQRYNLSPEVGQKCLIIGGILFALVAVISLILYIKKRNADN